MSPERPPATAPSAGLRDHVARTLQLAMPVIGARCGLLVLYSDTERYFSFLGEGLFRSMAELFSLVLSNEGQR